MHKLLLMVGSHRNYKDCLKAGSHDPIFGSDFFSGIVSAHRNVDSRQYLNLSKNRIQKLDRVNQP